MKPQLERLHPSARRIEPYSELWCLLNVDEFAGFALPERMPSFDVAFIAHDQAICLALPGEQCEIETIADRIAFDCIRCGNPGGKFRHRDEHDAAVRMIEFHAFPRVGAEPPQDTFLTPGECG